MHSQKMDHLNLVLLSLSEEINRKGFPQESAEVFFAKCETGQTG